jgi:hypothetical protein
VSVGLVILGRSVKGEVCRSDLSDSRLPPLRKIHRRLMTGRQHDTILNSVDVQCYSGVYSTYKMKCKVCTNMYSAAFYHIAGRSVLQNRL